MIGGTLVWAGIWAALWTGLAVAAWWQGWGIGWAVLFTVFAGGAIAALSFLWYNQSVIEQRLTGTELGELAA